MAPTSGNAASRQDLTDEETPAADGARSNYGSVPGAELPVAVYVSVFVAFTWILVASWVAFANDADADLALGMAAVFTVVFFALPVLVRLTTRARAGTECEASNDFLASRVETATGPLTGASAWLQIVLIPAALALAATLIGVTSMLVH